MFSTTCNIIQFPGVTFEAVFLMYFCVIDCGQVLTCGSNAYGQLGVAKTSTHSAEPVLVEVNRVASLVLTQLKLFEQMHGIITR